MFSAVESYKSWCKKSISTANSVPKLPHVVTTNIEHPAVDLPLRQWSEEGTIGRWNVYQIATDLHYCIQSVMNDCARLNL